MLPRCTILYNSNLRKLTILSILSLDRGEYSRIAGAGVGAESVVWWESTGVRFIANGEYLFIFTSTFVEIRSLKSGRPIQFIPGRDIRCLSDGNHTDDKTSRVIAATADGLWLFEPTTSLPPPKSRGKIFLLRQK